MFPNKEIQGKSYGKLQLLSSFLPGKLSILISSWKPDRKSTGNLQLVSNQLKVSWMKKVPSVGIWISKHRKSTLGFLTEERYNIYLYLSRDTTTNISDGAIYTVHGDIRRGCMTFA